ncbi:FAD-dependent oxidoreductase [Geodermatophilus sp. SYSU D00815]
MSAPGLGTPRSTDVVVVGGGVTGSATARELARRGVGVVLLERLGPPGARATDAAVAPLQADAGTLGAVVRHHREVLAVERTPGDGVLVRSAAGAAVRARAAVVAAGRWSAGLLGGAVRLASGGVVLHRVGPVVVAAGLSRAEGATPAALGRLVADLALADVGAPLLEPTGTW